MEWNDRFLSGRSEAARSPIRKDNPRMMVIGEKESFLIRALLNKCDDAGLEAFYCPAEIKSISYHWEKATLIVYYLERGERSPQEVLIYLADHLAEGAKQLILIGDPEDLTAFQAGLGKTHVLETYVRPLQVDSFIRKAKGYLQAIQGAAVERKHSIMIVDDDPTYCGLLREWLHDKYRVFTARSGKQALSVLPRNTPELVLLDYEMPEMNGPEVFQAMSEDRELRKIPVIFLTGKSDRDSVVTAVSMKPRGYLLKTIDRGTLLKELNNFFRKQEMTELKYGKI